MVYYLIGVYGEKLMIISGDYACPVKNGTPPLFYPYTRGTVAPVPPKRDRSDVRSSRRHGTRSEIKAFKGPCVPRHSSAIAERSSIVLRLLLDPLRPALFSS